MLDLLDVDRPLTPQEVDRVTQTMTKHYRWPDLGLDASEFRQEVSALKNPQLRDIVELVYCKHLERDHKVRWGDKTPGYIAIAPQLARMFPGSQFIHFIRDGRDVAKSFHAKRWYGRWLHDNTQEWNEAMEFNARWMNLPLSSRILQVRYEDLVLDTEKTIRKICTFLGEQFEPQMLSWQERVDELVPAREVHIHEKLKQAPQLKDTYRWKREMTTREVFVCEAFMGKHLEALGYELRFRGSSWVPFFALTRWYCRYILPIVAFPIRAARFLRDRLLRQPAFPQQADARDVH